MWGRRALHAALPALFSATLSPALSVYLCPNVGPQGLLLVRLPAMVVPHSASLGPATATRVLSTLVPVSAPPTGLDICFFFIHLVSDFLALGFSVGSCCGRRRNVSTYPAILVLSRSLFFYWSRNLQIFLNYPGIWEPPEPLGGCGLSFCSLLPTSFSVKKNNLQFPIEGFLLEILSK